MYSLTDDPTHDIITEKRRQTLLKSLGRTVECPKNGLPRHGLKEMAAVKRGGAMVRACVRVYVRARARVCMVSHGMGSRSWRLLSRGGGRAACCVCNKATPHHTTPHNPRSLRFPGLPL